MKIQTSVLPILLAVSTAFMTGCASTCCKQKPSPPATAASGKHASADDKSVKAADGKSVKAGDDEVDEYAAVKVCDPWEPFNRGTFQVNHGIYMVLLRPLSKGYKAVVPKPARQGIYNVFENVKFPIRFVNDLLQANFQRAGQETGKFVVNTVVGVGGIGTPAEHIPALANVPPADTGQTFAKWGIKSGPYFVIPVLGPSTVRDTVGLIGDYALNPISWVSIVFGGYTWIIAVPTTNTVRALPVQMDQYDAATKNSLDRYLAARSAYIQYRKEVISK